MFSQILVAMKREIPDPMPYLKADGNDVFGRYLIDERKKNN